MGCSDPPQRSTTALFSRGGTLPPCIYADVRCIDDVIAFLRPCKLYFDLEYARALCPSLSAAQDDALIEAFIVFTLQFISKEYPNHHPRAPTAPTTTRKRKLGSGGGGGGGGGSGGGGGGKKVSTTSQSSSASANVSNSISGDSERRKGRVDEPAGVPVLARATPSSKHDGARSTVLDLESSTAKKFSRHLIFTETTFRDNVVQGHFVNKLAAAIAASSDPAVMLLHSIVDGEGHPVSQKRLKEGTPSYREYAQGD